MVIEARMAERAKKGASLKVRAFTLKGRPLVSSKQSSAAGKLMAVGFESSEMEKRNKGRGAKCRACGVFA